MTTFLSHIYFVWDMWSLNCLAGKIDLIFWKTRQIVACRACSLAPALKWNKDFFFLERMKISHSRHPPQTYWCRVYIPTYRKKYHPFSKMRINYILSEGRWYLFCLALTPAKGQLISKCLFDVFNFSKKTDKTFRLLWYLRSTCSRLFFGRN